MKLTQSARDAIQNKIVEIERQTSVEYVPCFVERSSNYGAYRGLLAGFAAFLALFASRVFWVNAPLWGEFAGAWLVAGAVFAVSGVPVILNAILPPSLKQAEVLEAAHGVFLREEVFATKARTGVLIYISELEQAVFVLADRGLRAKVKDEEWSKLASHLAHDLHRGQAGHTFLEALDQLSSRLAPDFPPSANNVNELPDYVRE